MEKVVLFASKEYGKNKKIKKLCVSDEKLEKHFVFEVDQKHYKKSLDELFVELEKFCKEDCHCYDSGYCDIFFLRYDNDFDDSVESFLGSVDWICIENIEFLYLYKTPHIKNPLPFDDYIKQIDDEENSPKFVAKVYELFKKEIDKENFTEDDITNMVEYIKSAKLFEKSDKFYEQKISTKNLAFYLNLSVSEALVRLAICDKPKFVESVDYVCEQFIKVFEKSNSYTYIIRQMLENILDEYTEKTDFNYWRTDEAHEVLTNKYFSIFADCKHYELLKIVAKSEKLVETLRKECDLNKEEKISETNKKSIQHKKIFVGIEWTNDKKYKKITAISEDEKQHFEYTFEQKYYENGKYNMLDKFTFFCKGNDISDECQNCDVYLLEDVPIYDSLFSYLLNFNVANVYCLEWWYDAYVLHTKPVQYYKESGDLHEIYYKEDLIPNALPFKEYIKRQGNVSGPFLTKKVYQQLVQDVELNMFNKDRSVKEMELQKAKMKFNIIDIEKSFYDFFEMVNEEDYYKVDLMLDTIKDFYKKEYENLVRKLVVYVTNVELIGYNYDWATDWESFKRRILYIMKNGRFSYCYNDKVYFEIESDNRYRLYSFAGCKRHDIIWEECPQYYAISKEDCYKKYNSLFFENGKLGYYRLYMQLKENLHNFVKNYDVTSKFDLETCLKSLRLFYSNEDFQLVKNELKALKYGLGLNGNPPLPRFFSKEEDLEETFDILKAKNQIWWLYMMQLDYTVFCIDGFMWDNFNFILADYKLVDCLEFSTFEEVQNMKIDDKKIALIQYGHLNNMHPDLDKNNTVDRSLDQLFDVVMKFFKNKYPQVNIEADSVYVEELFDNIEKPYRIFLWEKRNKC